MKQINHESQSKAALLLQWLLPTTIEVAIYILITLITVVVFNTDFIRDFLLVPENFSLQTALLGSVEKWLAKLVGENIAATLITGIFWAIVGIAVYFALRVFGNFSQVLGNDLMVTRYMHPRGDDTYSPLKALFLRIVFHVIFAIVFVLYINFFINRLLSYFSDNLAGIPFNWSDASNLLSLGKIILVEIAALHIFVVLTRLLLLRKRVFGSGV